MTNNMPTVQYVRVNGVGHWIAPGATMNVSVPTGSATTELVGWEAVKNWSERARRRATSNDRLMTI